MTEGFETKSISGLIKDLKRMKKEFGDVTLKFCENEMVQKFKELEKENTELKKTVEHYRKERAFFIGELEND